MYNRQLDTFMKVCETGSFSSAAECLFVTPSAVIQQIKSLEAELDVRLFNRSSRGVSPSKAGKYLYDEAAEYIRKGCEIKNRLKTIDEDRSTIILGTSADYKVRVLYDLWVLYSSSGSNKYEIQLSGLSFDGSNAHDTDLIESVRCRMAWQGHMQFFKLFDVPIGIGVSRHHPLWQRDILTLDDLAAYPLLIGSHAFPLDSESFLSALNEHRVSFEPVGSYSPHVVWEASLQNRMLLAPMCWSDSLWDMKIIPVKWDFTLEYGIFYHNHAQSQINDFIGFIRQVYDPRNPLNLPQPKVNFAK